MVTQLQHGQHKEVLPLWLCRCLAMARFYQPLPRDSHLFCFRYTRFKILRHNITLKVSAEYCDLADSTYTGRAGSRVQVTARTLFTTSIRGVCGYQFFWSIPGRSLALRYELSYPHSFQHSLTE
jgi:hypothetical protein